MTMQTPKKFCKPAQEIINPFEVTPEEKEAFEEAISQDSFLNAVTFIQQLVFLCERLRSGSLKVKYRQLGNVFEISRQKAQKCQLKFLRGEGIDCRPPILSPEELLMVENEIVKLHQKSIYPTINSKI